MRGPVGLRVWRSAGGHPLVVDAVIGVLVAGISLVAVVRGDDDRPGRPLTAGDVTVAGLVLVLIAARSRWPLPVFAAATLAEVVGLVVGGWQPVLVATAVAAAYTVAASTDRRTAWVAGSAAALILFAAGVLWSGYGWQAPQNLAVFAWIGMAIGFGDAARNRRDYLAATEERAQRAERTRDEEARRRVAEERVRIARELHDVVAHHIAVVNVQAGVAAHVLRDQPEQAEQALAQVRLAARTVLDELGTLLGVLRRPDDLDASTEPTRGLGRLSELLDSLAAAGLRVEHRQEGHARPLSAVVDLAAYRIIQESLTNAQKHGSAGTARLSLAYGDEEITIDVSNPAVAGPGSAGTGHGLLGMRERAAAVGGSLTAALEPAGRFTVHAALPAPQPAKELSR